MNEKTFSKKSTKTAFNKVIAILMTIVLVFWQTPIYAHANDPSSASASPVTEPAAVEQQVEQPAAVEQQVAEPAAVEQQIEEPAAVEQQVEEPAAVEQQAQEPVAEEQQAVEPAAAEQQVEEPAAVEQQAQEPAAVDQQAQEPVVEEQQAAEPNTSNAPAPAANTGSSESASGKSSDSAASAGTNSSASAPSSSASSSKATSSSSSSAAASGKSSSASSASKESADKKEEKKRNTKATFVHDDGYVRVTATLSNPDGLPEGVEFRVTPVTPYSGGYNYGAYMQALNNSAAEGVEYTDNNTMLYDIAFLAKNDDGKLVEVQPEKGTVSVNIVFEQQQLSAGIGAEESAEVEVTHLPLYDGAKADTTAESTSVSAGDVIVDTVNANVSVESETASFVTSSFSVYAFSYTVDFTYEEFTYKFPGQGSYALADVFAALGINDGIDSAELLLVDGLAIEGDLYLTQQGGVWYINSDVPFTSTYELSVKCGNATYVITVTDTQESSDLTNFLKNVVITGATQNADGEYEVEVGKDYSFILSFGEDSSYQFDNDATLTYQIPAGIEIIEQQQGPLKINIVYKGRTYQVDANYVLTTDGLLSVTFVQDDPDYPRLEESTNVSFRYTYHAQFDGTEDKIHFSDEIERDIVFDGPEPGEAYAEKTATYDEETGTFHYTITVTATGDVTSVNVKDDILGDVLVFDNNVAVSPSSKSYTDNHATNGFDYTFASMSKDETITITYSAHVDFSLDEDQDGKITADQTKNTVTVKPDDVPPHNSEYSHEITYKHTIKSDGTEVGTTESGDKILQWTIDYNPLALVPVGKDTVTDTIALESRDYMTYDESYGVKVEVRDRSGNLVRTDNLSYNQLTEHNAYSWKYTVPEGDTTPYSYHIIYQTIVDMDKVEQQVVPVNLDNDGNGDHGGASVSPSQTVDVKKDVESYTTEEVNWVSTLYVPKAGLAQAVATDTLPARWFNGSTHYDVYKDGTLDIQGLLPGESYDVETTTAAVKITFYYTDDSGRHDGLKGSTNGRTITVRLTTKVNQEWLQEGYETQDLQSHVNTIEFYGKTDTATVIYGKPGIEKTVDRQSDGSFLYTILLSGDTFDPPISITDTFDTSLLEIDTSKAPLDDHMRIAGGTQWSQVAGKIPVAYSETNTGILITANTLPLDESGNYFPYYKISYYLKLKDGVDLEQLAIANGGEHHLINTARWGDHEGNCDYKTVYDFLDKQLLNTGEIGGRVRTAQYRIVFNSAQATLNGGEPMEMKDVLSSNLSLNYGSISIVTDPAGIEVPYSISGGKDETGAPDGTTVATYLVPDSTRVVITYTAEVRGNGSQKIVNKVTVNGDEDTEEHTQDYGDADEGEGAIASFKIVKVDGYNANKKLEGVKFKIFAENPELYFDVPNNTLQEIELETDENGEIILDGENYTFFFNELYWVHEVEAPEDYGNIGFDYQVTLTNEMSQVDYGHYIYYYSDSMQIKNWPLEGLVVEKQVDSDAAADKDRYYTFRVSILKDDGNGGTTVDTDYNEKNGDDQFENGVVEFQIKDREQKMFWGFAKGTKYKVEEIDADGFATTVTYSIFDEEGNITETITAPGTSHSGELTQSDEVIVFKNSKHEYGSLKVKKNVTVNGQATTGTSADGTYTFTIAGPGGYESEQTITITNGVSNEVQVDDLVPGDYTVSEDTSKNPEGMSLVGENGKKVEVTANNTANVPTAEFTNNIDFASIEVDKVWANADATDDWPEDVTVDIQLTADGKAVTGKTATLSADQPSYKFEKLPKYQADGETEIAYAVEEGELKGYASTVEALADGKFSITNTENVKTSIPFKKVFYGTGAASTFEFKLTSLGEAGKNMWASESGITLPSNAEAAEEPMLDDGKVIASMTKSLSVVPGTEADSQFGEVQFAADGDYYYAIEEVAGGDQGIVYDKSSYLAHVKITDNKVDGDIEYRMLYPSADGTYDHIGAAEVPEFINNEGKNSFATLRFRSVLMNAQDASVGMVSVYPEIQKTVNYEDLGDSGATTAMIPGEFTFELREGNDGKGELIASASNDENGRVAFFDKEKADNIGENWGLVFVNPGTYEYTITEQKGTAFGVRYDDSQILMTVEVTQADDGELAAKVTYAKDGEVTDMPTLNNEREGMDLQVYKRSRFGGEGLDNCTYALWMHSSTGDVMLQEATSDATGLIRFENVVLIPGQEYFYKEVEAPAGHTVDPYRTAYWTVEVGEDGKVSTKIVEETADDGWHSKYENIQLDKQGE